MLTLCPLAPKASPSTLFLYEQTDTFNSKTQISQIISSILPHMMTERRQRAQY